jgi:2,3-bisphosphoglycerate-independent phosphoglycerate mutase
VHKKRIILIVGDGMADRPLPELNGRTPLEVANPINMHRLAANGISGLLDPVAPGIVPGTETAHLSILGYDPTIASSGRGPFEAAGAGIDIKAGDVAFRCNFATVTEDFIVVDEHAGRIQTEAAELAKELQNIQIKKFPDVKLIFKQTLSFRGALILRGDKLSPNVSAVMPQPGDFVGSVKPSNESFEATRTAQILTEFIKTSNALLKNHPINLKRKAQSKPAANAVLPWGGGHLPQMEPFNKKYGLQSACIAAASIIKGIGKLVGMDIVNVKGATGEIDTDTTAKADAVLKSLKDYNFVLVHIEAADEASHDGNFEGKIEIIKKIDAMVGRILDNISLNDVNVVLLSDHVTSTQLRKHTADPVPFVVAGAKVIKDGVKEFSECAARQGGLQRIQGKQVMPLIMDLLNNSNRTLG